MGAMRRHATQDLVHAHGHEHGVAACGMYAEQLTHDSSKLTCPTCVAALARSRKQARWLIAAASMIASLRLGDLETIQAAGFDVRELMARCEVAGVTDPQGVGFRDELEQYVGELLVGEVTPVFMPESVADIACDRCTGEISHRVRVSGRPDERDNFDQWVDHRPMYFTAPGVLEAIAAAGGSVMVWAVRPVSGGYVAAEIVAQAGVTR